MTSIWNNDGSGRKLLTATGFPDEAALHTLVERAPHVLPLSGGPQLVMIGREVPLGNGKADLLAIEPTGRLAIIEVKLGRNAEARRAVVSQVLAYAAYLAGTDPGVLQQDLVGAYLRDREYETLADAVTAVDQEGLFDQGEFSAGLAESLGSGRFRPVLVLDVAPDELVRLVGYLESVTDKLVIDLVTVSAYEINGSQVIVPQRVEPERQSHVQPDDTTGKTIRRYVKGSAKSTRRYVEGSAMFVASIDEEPDPQPILRKLAEWAEGLESDGLARLATVHGEAGDTITLWPRLLDEDRALVAIRNSRGNAIFPLRRTVFERRAPLSIERVEAAMAPTPLGDGKAPHEITDELLAAVREAYREAAGVVGRQPPE